ncbi:MAG: ATP-binding protein [Leptospiraceae bacterium]
MFGLEGKFKSRNWSESRLAPMVAFTLPLILTLSMLVLVVDFENRRYRQELRARMTDQLSELRGRMESEINKTMYLTRGLTAFLAVNPRINASDFHAIAEEILSSKAHIRNIGLAPDNVIRYVYPVKGNETAIGLNYRNNAEQWPSVERMMRTQKTSIAGPVDLVQGGRAFIARTPVYVGKGEYARYWGLVSVVIDTPSLLSASGLGEEQWNYLAIRGTDGQGSRGEVFWGDESVFDSDPVLLNVRLPEGSWQLGAIPREGWKQQSPGLWLIWTIGSAACLLLSTGLYLWVFRQRSRYIELRRITTVAEAASKAKSEFLANMSHEIRTPLNATLGFADLLDDELTDPQQRQYLSAIRKNGRSLLNLLNDILDLSRIEAGKLQINPVSCDWRQLCDEIRDVFAYMIQQKGLSWISDYQDNLPRWILTDEHRLRQILLNLAGNAVKFTDSGSVTLRVRGHKDNDDQYTYEFQVIDTGPGIAEPQKIRIFEAFVQDKAIRRERQEGSGLGLTISSRLAHLLGGHIELESEIGRGSHFTLVLDRILAAQRVGLSAEAQQSGKPYFNGQKVLLVDDNEDNRTLVSHYLKDERLKLIQAINGAEGLEMARRELPDIILLDLHMPVMDGYEMLSLLRAESEIRSIPVILFTADAMEENINRMKSYRTADILTKPLSRKRLLTSLHKQLDRNL